MLPDLALVIALGASAALAHFTLDYPTSRGFDDNNEPQFCGGFTNVETRQPFSLGSGPVWIDSHHTLATVDAFLSVSVDPTSFNDFNTTSNGTTIPMVTNFFQVNEGEHCWNVNLGALGIGLTNGSLVTLQIQYNGGDGNLYQCTDLVLLSNYTVPSNWTCTVDATVAGNATVSSSASATSSAAAASTSKSAAMAVADLQVDGWGLLGLAAGVAGLAVL
ncbi:hypothetical protein EHS25_004852 [Saitozyma podzolica]|uniref:Copper acquisition factor BIM1-like domain-containing protein n=1 Tax=Saitozyma podzolica TaxID=1890683 RepID=A0A427Y2T5_9TREE|nr:hypothetical protein EHS25_004852 [Saitozyma podzolica]